ncbi:MAG: hypothetical protein AAGF68_02620 [Pseudomonadota bacterium]
MSAAPSRASALLDAVFPLSGRGTVGIFSDFNGVVQVGDMAQLADGTVAVKGVEHVRTAEPRKVPAEDLGLLLDETDTGRIRALIGTRIAFSAEAP